jgi:hypothetical protein
MLGPSHPVITAQAMVCIIIIIQRDGVIGVCVPVIALHTRSRYTFLRPNRTFSNKLLCL